MVDSLKFMVFLMFCLLSSVSLADSKEMTFKVQATNQSGVVEQLAIRIIENKARLTLNTNRWSTLDKIGWFETTDVEQIQKLKTNFTWFERDGVFQAAESKHHATKVWLNGKLVARKTKQYEQALEFVSRIFRSYKWSSIDSITIKDKMFYSSKQNKHVPFKDCQKLGSKHFLCKGDLGVFHLSYNPFQKQLKKP